MKSQMRTLCALATLAAATAGCGAPDGDGTAASDETVGTVSQPIDTIDGTLHLMTYNSGNWYISVGDSNVTLVNGNFGDIQDIPLVGYGSVTCGAGGGVIGTYRPSTKQFFIDLNANAKWDPGIDGTYSNFTSGFTGTIYPFIFTVPVSGTDCKGVLGFASVTNGTMTWVVDLNDDKQRQNNEIISNQFGGGQGNEDWPVPMWSPQFGRSILTVFRRNTGQWFKDADNNGAWSSSIDTTEVFGNPGDLPFAHSNSRIRGTTRQVNLTTTRFVDVNGNGFWDLLDKSYDFRTDPYALLF